MTVRFLSVSLLPAWVGLTFHSLSAVAQDSKVHEGVHDAVGIPVTVAYQAINFAIYIGILVYILRKPIRQFFKTREDNYRQALIKAEHARREAEQRRREIEERLVKLESTSAESISHAKAEALALMGQIQKQADELALRLRQEAKRSSELELDRAKAVLRQEVLTQALQLSKTILKEKMAEPDQKRLQTEFVDKIREVHA